MGLPRDLRLRHPHDFERLRQQGKTYRHRLLLINLAANTLPHNRYGIVTGKRLGKAVIRNRVRRLLRESLRQLDPLLQTGYDVVVVAHPPILEQPQGQIQRIVFEVLRQTGIVRQDE